MIVLVGFMGAGKTTVGGLLADKLGLTFVDTDQVVEREHGRSVSEIFEQDGEGVFRTLERDAVARVLESGEGVVSIGGGAIKDPVTCAALGWHTVIFLDVGYQEAMRRVGHDPGRPLLHFADPKALYDERKPIYQRLATHTIDTSGLPPEEVMDRIIETASLEARGGPTPVQVDLGQRSYPIFVGADIAGDVSDLVNLADVQRAFVVTHPQLTASAKTLVDSLATVVPEVVVTTVPEGESSKSLSGSAAVWEEMTRTGAHRGDLVVGFGGGVVCDLAGFIASTYHRGMRVLHVPTTLLAQVDAAIGGKTAVNLPSGKNLVGTIHQPIAVVCDVSYLRSLPDEELRSGMAEVVKYGLISDPSLLDLVSSQIDRILDRDEEVLVGVVRRSAAIKAAVVSADEREEGRREILNYGHTFGHAIEHVSGMRHGEAVAIGMVAAAHLSVDLGMLSEDAIALHTVPLEAVGLPISAALDIDAVVAALKKDKKHRENVRFVLLDAVGSPGTGVDATDDQIVSALRKVAA